MEQGKNPAADLDRLRQEVLVLRRLLHGTIFLFLIAILAGAAAETQFKGDVCVSGLLKCLGLKVEGPVEVAKGMVLKEGFFVNGDINATGRAIVGGLEIKAADGKLIDIKAGLESTRKQILKYASFEETFNLDTMFPHHPQISTLTRGPFPGKVVAAWYEPLIDIVSMDDMKRFIIHPKGNKIDIEVQKQRPGGAFFHIRFHILYIE